MDINNVEAEIINCIRDKFAESGEEVPDLAGKTEIFTGISGFDSLLAIEVLVDLEGVFDCPLPPEKVFIKVPPKTENIGDIAKIVHSIISQEKP